MSLNNCKNITKLDKLKIYNQPYTFFKKYYKSIVPLNIFQTWVTKDLPPKMHENVERLKQQNPRFNHYLFDDNDCREFIKDNFEPDVLNAYDILIPGAYKADLWRLCVLYIHGGIYIDIKLNCINGFKLIELTERNHYVKDRVPPLSIYNALMACQTGSPFLKKAIYRTVLNINKRYYGNTPLDPTGPVLLGKIAMENNLFNKIDLFHYQDGGYLIYKNRFVISLYPEYNKEQQETYAKINTKRYNELWNERAIYKINVSEPLIDK